MAKKVLDNSLDGAVKWYPNGQILEIATWNTFNVDAGL